MVGSCDRCCTSSRVANRSTQRDPGRLCFFLSDTFFFCLCELYFRLGTRSPRPPLPRGQPFLARQTYASASCLSIHAGRVAFSSRKVAACCQVNAKRAGKAFAYHVHVDEAAAEKSGMNVKALSLKSLFSRFLRVRGGTLRSYHGADSRFQLRSWRASYCWREEREPRSVPSIDDLLSLSP